MSLLNDPPSGFGNQNFDVSSTHHMHESIDGVFENSSCSHCGRHRQGHHFHGRHWQDDPFRRTSSTVPPVTSSSQSHFQSSSSHNVNHVETFQFQPSSSQNGFNQPQQQQGNDDYFNVSTDHFANSLDKQYNETQGVYNPSQSHMVQQGNSQFENSSWGGRRGHHRGGFGRGFGYGLGAPYYYSNPYYIYGYPRPLAYPVYY